MWVSERWVNFELKSRIISETSSSHVTFMNPWCTLQSNDLPACWNKSPTCTLFRSNLKGSHMKRTILLVKTCHLTLLWGVTSHLSGPGSVFKQNHTKAVAFAPVVQLLTQIYPKEAKKTDLDWLVDRIDWGKTRRGRVQSDTVSLGYN